MKRSKVFEQILNGLVLLGSLAIIIVASIELLDGNNALSETFILKFHLWVCGLFLADFFVRWYTDGWTGRFFNHNLFFLLVSIPYLNIVYHYIPFHVANPAVNPAGTGYLRGITYCGLDDT